jgi:hypothetical protein
MIASYMQRMQRAQSIQRTWNTLRKKDKASLMASLGSDSALAEAALPNTWDSQGFGNCHATEEPRRLRHVRIVLTVFVGC